MTNAFRMASDGVREIDKAPAAVLDYTIDLAAEDWLQVAEAITGVVWAVAVGLDEVTHQFSDTTTTLWLSGGIVGEVYLVSCTFTTNQGRTDTRSFRVFVKVR